MQFLSVMKRGFTLSIITIFKKKEKFNYKELVKNYETFQVKIIQLYYDDDYDTYQTIKEENITDIVTI